MGVVTSMAMIRWLGTCIVQHSGRGIRSVVGVASFNSLFFFPTSWSTLVYKNFEIEKACKELERSIQLQKAASRRNTADKVCEESVV